MKYVTPGSFTLPSKFGVRVLTSWYITHALIACLAFIFSGGLAGGLENPNLSESLVNCLFSFPIAICIYGLVGIAIDKIRGNSLYYPSLYWYIYPWVTAIFIAIYIIVFGLALVGISLPKNQNRIINRDRLREAIKESSLEDFLENFEDALEEMIKMERAGELDSEQSQVIRKLRNLDRSKYNRKIGSLFDEEEYERLFFLILILMSVEK